MSYDTKKLVKKSRDRTYLNKDFDGLSAELYEYARTFFPDKIKDFGPSSVGGLFLDFASFVGDTMSFYLDHQFKELNFETAVETENIQKMLRSSGIKVTGKSPSIVAVDFIIEVPSKTENGTIVPDSSALPVIEIGTIVKSNSGIEFELIQKLDFSKKNSNNDYVASTTIATTTNGAPQTFFMSLTGYCMSGKRETETFSIENVFVPFRKITLQKEDVTRIVSVTDSNLNEYFEVENLSQDVVFKAVDNTFNDSADVDKSIEILPVPYRYTKSMDYNSKLTTLQFGSGQADSLDNDIIPDPSQFAIPLYGKSTMSRFSIDPGNFLKTQTLGISPKGVNLTVTYMHGGGIRHNVSSNSIRTIEKLLISFKNGPTSVNATTVRRSVDVINRDRASGGEDAPTLSELQSKVPSIRNSQSRIVTKDDLLSRIYTMPSEFGRVFRAGIRSNPINPLTSQLFIISRDVNKNLVISPDTLKNNLSSYLNQYRLISDAIDILDAQVINYQIKFNISVNYQANKNEVLQKVIVKLKNAFLVDNFSIDQPLSISSINNIIYNEPGVVSVINIKIDNLTNVYSGRQYSNVKYDMFSNTKNGLVFPPPGGIFELKYPNFDIIGSAV